MKHIFGKKAGQSGFSLVELMIVVGIIGVLATLALPRFKQFQAKAKMAEAQNVLQHIYTLEQSYALDNTLYMGVASIGANTGTVNTNLCTDAGATILGLKIEPCQPTGPTPRFNYGVVINTSVGFDAAARTGIAANNRICPNNLQFTIALDEGNLSTWGVGNAAPGPSTGTPQIGTVCIN